jgi:hypothetical protein
MPLLLHEAGLARAMSESLILKRAFAPLVTYGTIKWVVGKQKFQNSMLGLLHRI